MTKRKVNTGFYLNQNVWWDSEEGIETGSVYVISPWEVKVIRDSDNALFVFPADVAYKKLKIDREYHSVVKKGEE